jgi:hypothetical protein
VGRSGASNGTVAVGVVLPGVVRRVSVVVVGSGVTFRVCLTAVDVMTVVS